jgi:hypothetical protein
MKRPAFQFYPADWRKDASLQLCSIAARGLWIEMLCIAHECEEYGKLQQNGMGFSHQTLGKLAGLSPQTCKKLLGELERNGVFSRDNDGAIYSRRMIRDEHIRKIRAEAGIKGGNPHLLGNLVKQKDKQKPTPSSSSLSSSSNTEGGEEIEFPAKLQTSRFRQAWNEYLDYRKAAKFKPLQPASIKAQFKKLSEIGHDIAIEAITNSIANGWQGIFPPKGQKPMEARKTVVSL